MRSFRLLPFWVVFLSSGCGADEFLEPAPKPNDQQNADADSGVDLCAALRELTAVPGVLERLCAQGSSPATPDATQQCQTCAASAGAVESLFPTFECTTELRECPLENAEFRQCLATIGTIMVDVLPACDPADVPTPPVEPAELALRIATSSCAPVLSDCPPLQQLVLNLLGTTF